MENKSHFRRLPWIIAIISLTFGFYALIIGFPGLFNRTEPIPITSCASCCPDNTCYQQNCEFTDPFDLELAVKMIHNYRINHWEAINANCPSIVNQSTPFCNPCTYYTNDQPSPSQPSFYEGSDNLYNKDKIDARSAWFSLETLKKFIHTIESKTCSHFPASCPKPNLGIRIYYAEYPTKRADLPQNFNIDDQYAGLHTLLMIPTFDMPGATVQHIDFDPEKITSCPGTSIFDTSVITSSTITALAAQNHGGLAPPPVFADGTGGYWNSTGAYFMKYVDMYRDCYFSPIDNPNPACATPKNYQPPIGRP